MTVLDVHVLGNWRKAKSKPLARERERSTITSPTLSFPGAFPVLVLKFALSWANQKG